MLLLALYVDWTCARSLQRALLVLAKKINPGQLDLGQLDLGETRLGENSG